MRHRTNNLGIRRGNFPNRHALALIAAAVAFARMFVVPANAADPAQETAVPVGAVRIERSDLIRRLVVQGEFRPYQEIDLHSKIAGFLATLNVDIGDVVTNGQVIGTIEVPELEQDLRRGMASQRRAEQEVIRADATARETHLTLTRLRTVNESNAHLIAQQDLDTAQSKENVATATLGAAREQVEVSKEDVNRYRTMLSYAKLLAPFPGVITKRYANPGALIPAGTASTAQALPVVRLSENNRLRFVFPVSVPFVAQMQVGTPLEIKLDGRAKVVPGTIARSARKVELSTRTMEVEADIPNPDLSIIPGMYASATIPLERHDQCLAIPVEAITRGKSNLVYVINGQNRIEERAVALGLETPARAEVLNGLAEHEWVLVGTSGKVRVGQLVEPHAIQPSAAQ